MNSDLINPTFFKISTDLLVTFKSIAIGIFVSRTAYLHLDNHRDASTSVCPNSLHIRSTEDSFFSFSLFSFSFLNISQPSARAGNKRVRIISAFSLDNCVPDTKLKADHGVGTSPSYIR
jgi:hypothetical protein